MLAHPYAAVYVALALLIPSVGAQPTLTNPGFEEAAGAFPAGWAKAIHGEGFALSRDTTTAHSGEASARLDGDPGAADRACFLQTTAPLDAPQGVRLRFWYRGTGVSTGILRFRPAPGVEVEGGAYETLSVRNSLPQEEWAERVFEAAVPTAAREARQAISSSRRRRRRGSRRRSCGSRAARAPTGSNEPGN